MKSVPLKQVKTTLSNRWQAIADHPRAPQWLPRPAATEATQDAEVLEAEIMEQESEPSRVEQIRDRVQHYLRKIKPGEDPQTSEALDTIDQELEQSNAANIRDRFHRYIRKAKPEDVATIEQNIGRMKRGPIKDIWNKVEVLVQLIRDPSAAWKSKALAIAALVYLISPFDAIPDIIPIGGLADDVALIIVVVTTLAGEVENYMIRQAEQQAEIEIKKYNRIVRITLIGSIAAAILTLLVHYLMNN